MNATESPIAMKEGIALLEKLSLIEWSVQAAITGDNGPLTSSPNQRRNMSLLMADVASTFTILAGRIDPLGSVQWKPGDKLPPLRVVGNPEPAAANG